MTARYVRRANSASVARTELAKPTTRPLLCLVTWARLGTWRPLGHTFSESLVHKNHFTWCNIMYTIVNIIISSSSRHTASWCRATPVISSSATVRCDVRLASACYIDTDRSFIVLSYVCIIWMWRVWSSIDLTRGRQYSIANGVRSNLSKPFAVEKRAAPQQVPARPPARLPAATRAGTHDPLGLGRNRCLGCDAQRSVLSSYVLGGRPHRRVLDRARCCCYGPCRLGRWWTERANGSSKYPG